MTLAVFPSGADVVSFTEEADSETILAIDSKIMVTTQVSRAGEIANDGISPVELYVLSHMYM